MKLRTVREKFTNGQEFTLIPIGDCHLGSANSDKKKLEKLIRRIEEDPDARWIGMGDMVESIAPDDKRWAPDDVDTDVRENAARIANLYVEKLAVTFQPIIDKCWGWNDGNHEDKFLQKYYSNLTLEALGKLGKTYLDDRLRAHSDLYGEWSSITRIQFEDRNAHRTALKVYQQHGWQAGRMKGAKINNLDALMGYIVGCHIYLVAHSHERIVTSKTLLGTNDTHDGLVVYDAYGAHTGSFLRTYELDRVGYAEKRSFPPTSLGTVEFKLRPQRTPPKGHHRDAGVRIEAIL